MSGKPGSTVKSKGFSQNLINGAGLQKFHGNDDKNVILLKGGGNKMSAAVRSRKKAMLEDKIEQFCKNSAELLVNIHDRCDNTAGGKKTQKGKRRRKKKVEKE